MSTIVMAALGHGVKGIINSSFPGLGGPAPTPCGIQGRTATLIQRGLGSVWPGRSRQGPKAVRNAVWPMTAFLRALSLFQERDSELVNVTYRQTKTSAPVSSQFQEGPVYSISPPISRW